MTDREPGWFRGSGGVIWRMDLPLPEHMAEQVVKGYLTRVNEDGSTFVAPAPEDESSSEVEKPPSANASKGHWVGYAHRVHKVSIDDAEAMTKTDLMEKYGPKG